MSSAEVADVMHETVLIGPLTRDLIVEGGLRWSQPGGAAWHAALALALAVPLAGARVAVCGTAGPWATRFGAPGLAAAGVVWRGVATPRETTFVNRYDTDRRRQSLISSAGPLPLRALDGCDPAAAVVSPLMPDHIPPGVTPALRARGAFVAADAQGLLRVAGPGGRIATRPAQIGEALRGVQAVKFSQREFATYARLAPGAPWRAAALAAATDLRMELVVSLGPAGASLALPGAATLLDVPTPSLPGAADATGAGDILIATYARARSGGLDPGAALDRAVRQTHTVLQRRARQALLAAEGGLLLALRALQGAAAAVRRQVRRGDACTASFHAGGPLARALSAHLPVPLPLDGDAGSRGATVVAAGWALFTAGWPQDESLTPESLCALVAAERERADESSGLPSQRW